MNLFQTLLRPDREENPERAEVVDAANLLQVGEFQLLQLDYHDWYGRDVPAAMTDSLFRGYMIGNQVPFWARHYARKIIIRAQRGRLNDNDAAFHRYDSDYFRGEVSQGVRQFCIAAASIAAILVGSMVVSHYSVGETNSMLPLACPH